MARIPVEAVERLKREVSLTRLIEAQGLKLISQGKDLACRCPWHDGDDTPSCIVSPKTNLWHCFGCDAGGSVIDWVMRRHTVSFRHACELLTKQHPVLAAAPSANAAAPTVKISAGKLRTAQSFSLAAGDQELLDQVIDFYHTTLKASPKHWSIWSGVAWGIPAHRALPVGLCESHARVSARPEAVQSRCRNANRVAAGRYPARLGARAF